MTNKATPQAESMVIVSYIFLKTKFYQYALDEVTQKPIFGHALIMFKTCAITKIGA